VSEELNPIKDLLFEYIEKSNNIENLIREKKFDVIINEIIENCYDKIILMDKKEEEEVKTISSKIENTKPSHILQDYAGKYSHPGYGEFNITNQNDSLFVNFKLSKWYLRHEHYDIFEPFEVTKTGIDITDNSPLRFNFNTNDAGEISLVKMRIEGALDHPIEFKHTPNIIAVGKATLERYVGDYELAGTAIKVYIKNKSKLYVFVMGQPEYELLATDKHKFSFKALEGFKLEFIESDDKSLNEIVVRQPEGTFTVTRK